VEQAEKKTVAMNKSKLRPVIKSPKRSIGPFETSQDTLILTDKPLAGHVLGEIG
jgi:hypothetical protein